MVYFPQPLMAHAVAVCERLSLALAQKLQQKTKFHMHQYLQVSHGETQDLQLSSNVAIFPWVDTVYLPQPGASERSGYPYAPHSFAPTHPRPLRNPLK